MDKKVPRLYEKCNARVIVEVNFSSARVELLLLLPSVASRPFNAVFRFNPLFFLNLALTPSFFLLVSNLATFFRDISMASVRERKVSKWPATQQTRAAGNLLLTSRRNAAERFLSHIYALREPTFQTAIHCEEILRGTIVPRTRDVGASGGRKPRKRYQTADETSDTLDFCHFNSKPSIRLQLASSEVSFDIAMHANCWDIYSKGTWPERRQFW